MIAYFTRHPTIASLLMIALLVIGIYSFPQLRRETFPQIAPRLVQVTVAWPGSRPEEIEQAVCQRIEDAIDTVNNVDEIICEALEGLATAKIEKTDAVTLDRFTADVTNAIDGISDFPENVEKPVETRRHAAGPHRLRRLRRNHRTAGSRAAEGLRRTDQGPHGAVGRHSQGGGARLLRS